MQQKPARWNVSLALIDPVARGLWKDAAFVLPCFTGAHLGGNGLLLGPAGAPLRNASLTAGSTAQQRAAPYGYGIGISGASNLLQRDDYEPIVTSDGAGTGDFTILILANPISEARASYGVHQGNGSLGPVIVFNRNTAGTATAGTLNLVTRDGAGITQTSVAGVIDGNYHLSGLRRSGATVEGFIDGVSRASATGTVRDCAIGTHGLAIGQNAEASTNRIDTACNIVFAAAWNRALSNADMRLLARDPFIMFRPYAEWRKVWTPLGGDAVLSPSDPALSFLFEIPGFSQSQNLNIAEMAFAQSLEAAGFSQRHGLVPQEMNGAVFLDAAVLAMDSAGAPGFRTSRPAMRGKVKVTGTDNRTTQLKNDGGYKSITE